MSKKELERELKENMESLKSVRAHCVFNCPYEMSTSDDACDYCPWETKKWDLLGRIAYLEDEIKKVRLNDKKKERVKALKRKLEGKNHG